MSTPDCGHSSQRDLQPAHELDDVVGRRVPVVQRDLQPAVADRHRRTAEPRRQRAVLALDEELRVERGELVAARLVRRGVVDADDDRGPAAAQRCSAEIPRRCSIVMARSFPHRQAFSRRHTLRSAEAYESGG